jgi:hypothetical protein
MGDSETPSPPLNVKLDSSRIMGVSFTFYSSLMTLQISTLSARFQRERLFEPSMCISNCIFFHRADSRSGGCNRLFFERDKLLLKGGLAEP